MTLIPLWAKAAGLVTVVVAIFGTGVTIGYHWSDGRVAKAEARTAALQRDVAQVTADAVTDRAKLIETYRANNAQARAEYAKSIADLDRSSRDVAGRLFAAGASAACRGSLLEADGGPGTALALEIAASLGRLRDAAGRARTASLDDAHSRDALIAEIRPQL